MCRHEIKDQDNPFIGLYNAQYCVFQRALLILAAAQINWDCCNIKRNFQPIYHFNFRGQEVIDVLFDIYDTY